MAGKKKAPCSWRADTTRDVSFAGATNTRNISPKRIKRHSRGTSYCITSSAGEAFRIIVSGRDRWALEELRKAGARGCSPIQNPAPRWAAYVHNLRDLGVEIETITEAHEGDFPGHHARYVLRSGVSLGWQGGAA
ncbi:winged helix domain-containing protein [Roseovarius sp. S1116L3]|uniref:winged helix domain-containing protein n=1 Tax=Roseovarius roseus TaxID=3342636 RepID=UPI00372C8D16